MSLKIGQFIKLSKIMQDNLFLLSLQATEACLEHSWTFWQKSSTTDFWLVLLDTSLGNISPIILCFPSYIKLFVSLFLSCVFYFFAQIRKTFYIKEIKHWTFEVYLLTRENSSWFHWLNHWKWLVTGSSRYSWIFCQTGSLDCFS